ncbi:MAG: pilus assembly PilX N-terminal domain-containing protein [Actinomycetota bacterium]
MKRRPCSSLFVRVGCRIGDDSGFALVFAVLIVFVVMVLSTTVLSMSVHNVEQSAFDRRRVSAVIAAEAGLNHTFAFIAQATPSEISASGCQFAQTLAGEPQDASFTAVVTLYDAAGNTIPCEQAAANVPASLSLYSEGTVGGSVGGSTRRMESFVQLQPIYGGFDGAVVSESGLSLVNNLTINGDQSHDADVIVPSGNATISNNTSVAGSVYVPNGSATVSNNGLIRSDLWANSGVTITNNFQILGDVRSSASSISITNNAHVGGSATAGTSITGSANVSGGVYPNSPSAPPPSYSYPVIAWDEQDWLSAGYTVTTYTSCPPALAALAGQTLTGNRVIRIAAVCSLSFGGNTKIRFDGNLAVVTDGSIRSSNNVKWEAVNGSRSLFLIAAHQPNLSCAGGNHDIVDANNVAYPGARVLFYSTCGVTIANNSGFTGQVMGRPVSIANNFTMNYVPMVVPGTNVVGFDQSIMYLREARLS